MARKTLSPGTKIGRYVIQAEQYQDDAGVTYIGEDHGISYKPQVYIREFFPASISRRRRNEVHPARRALKVQYATALSHQADRINRYLDVEGKGVIPALDKIDAFGTVYLMTTWPTGESLQVSAERDGLLSPGFVRSLLSELGPGLQKLGEKGLVHGQIAPDMIRRLDTGDLCVTHPDRLEYCSGEGPVTLADPINTPYLAPEFVSTESGRIGPWCDVYSIAASFYQLVTGMVPVSAKERLDAVAAGNDDPLDLLVLDTKLDDDPALFSALSSGLALKAADRPASMVALSAAAEYSEATPTPEVMEATGLSTASTGSFWATNGRLIAALAAIFLIVAVAIPVFLMNGGTPDEPRVLAQNDVPPVEASVEEVEEAAPPVQMAEAEIEVEEEPVTEPAVPREVSAWLAVDQQDPDAVRAFYETIEDNPVLRAQVRARWITLEGDAWRAADAEGSPEAYQAFLAFYGDEVPTFARHYDDVMARLEGLEAGEETETTPQTSVLASVDEADLETEASLAEAEIIEASEPEETETPAAEVAEADESIEDERVVSVLTPVESDAPVSDEAPETGTTEDTQADQPPERELPAPVQTGPDSDCATCPTMVAVAGLPDMSVSAHEISVGEFSFYLAETGQSAPVGCFTHRLNSASIWGYGSSASYAEPGYPVTDASPASCVSYDEAVAYAEWLSAESGETYRLMTGEEWLAMAGEPSPGLMACGANFADQSLGAEGLQTPLLDCNDGKTYASAPSGNGLSMTYGNLAEWVSDCQGGDCNRRIAMGGSWVTGPAQIRGTMQDVFSPNSRSNTLGFRLLRE